MKKRTLLLTLAAILAATTISANDSLLHGRSQRKRHVGRSEWCRPSRDPDLI